jgi:hypothetical protein
MKKVVRLTESDLVRIVKKVIREQEVSEDGMFDDLKDTVKGFLGKSEPKKPYTVTPEIKNNLFDYLNSLSFDKDEKYGRIFYYENGKKDPTIIFDPTEKFFCYVYVSKRLAHEIAKKYDLLIPDDFELRGNWMGKEDAGYKLISNWVLKTENSKCNGVVPQVLYDSDLEKLLTPKGYTDRWDAKYQPPKKSNFPALGMGQLGGL